MWYGIPVSIGLLNGDIDLFIYLGQIWNTLTTMEKGKVEKAMAYLDEKIALTTKNGSWDGVDVDAFIDETRGREPDNH